MHRHKIPIKSFVGQYLSNPSWTKGVFFRDPVERFTSAYLSKCSGISPRSRHCIEAFGDVRATFECAINVTRRLTSFANAHWLQQSELCGGLNKHLHKFNTIEQLDPTNAYSKVLGFLTTARVNMTSEVAEAVAKYFPPVFPLSSDMALQARSGSMTHSSSRVAKLFDNNADTLAAVIRHYLTDYTLFNISLPSWQSELLRRSRRHADLLHLLHAS